MFYKIRWFVLSGANTVSETEAVNMYVQQYSLICHQIWPTILVLRDTVKNVGAGFQSQWIVWNGRFSSVLTVRTVLCEIPIKFMSNSQVLCEIPIKFMSNSQVTITPSVSIRLSCKNEAMSP